MISPRPSPIIAPGAGAELADIWVEKLISQWLEALDIEARAAAARFLKFSRSSHAAIGGNPKSQLRWAERAAQAFGEGLLTIFISPGKRAHFRLAVDCWRPMSATLSIAEEERRRANGTRGPLSWLYGLRFTLQKNGPRAPLRQGFSVPAALSKHALIRLVQRANIHTARELSETLAAAWPDISLAEIMTRSVRCASAGDTWLLPVTIPTQPQPIVFVLAGPTSVDYEFLFFAKSVLRFDMLSPEQQGAVITLHELLSCHSPAELSSDMRAETLAAFTMVRNR